MARNKFKNLEGLEKNWKNQMKCKWIKWEKTILKNSIKVKIDKELNLKTKDKKAAVCHHSVMEIRKSKVLKKKNCVMIKIH